MTDKIYNFGNLHMPSGYWVERLSCHEHYQAHGPNGWESDITCDPHQARHWCLDHRIKDAMAREGEAK